MKRLKKTLAIVLAVALLATVVPFAAFADDAPIFKTVLRTVNGVAYDYSYPIVKDDVITVDIVIDYTPAAYEFWMCGYSYDTSALELVSASCNVDAWQEATNREESGYNLLGALIIEGQSITAAENVVATLTFNVEDYTGATAVSIGQGPANKNYIGSAVTFTRIDVTDFESASFTIYEQTDKTALNAALADYATKDYRNYTPSSWSAVTTALPAAQAAAADNFASQADINAAEQALSSALAGLKPVADKTALVNLINDMLDFIDAEGDKYKPESIAALDAAIDTAQDVVDNLDASEEDVQAQIDAINAAYAARVLNSFTVTFYDADGNVYGTPQTVEFGGAATEPDIIPDKAADNEHYYTFLGWDTIFTDVQSDLDVHPTYQPQDRYYDIVFLKEDGSDYTTMNLLWNEEVIIAQPEKENTQQYVYTFTGWKDVNTDEVYQALPNVAGPATYQATFSSSLQKYVVNFYDEDGTTLRFSDEFEYGSTPVYGGDPLTKEATAQYTYTFTGWNPVPAEVTGPADYTAVFTGTVNGYAIAFLDESGAAIGDAVTYDFGASVTAPDAPEKPADMYNTYAFAGWKNIATEQVYLSAADIPTVSGPATYQATYEGTPIPYFIHFYAEDGVTPVCDPFMQGYDTPVEAPQAPVKQNTAQYDYTFAGWEDMETGTVYASSQIPAVAKTPTKYKATYSSSLNSYTVTFYDEDGTTFLFSEEFDYGETAAFNGTAPTKEKTAQYTFTFEGWDRDFEIVTGDTSYTAVYGSTVNEYDVVFYNDDDTVYTTVRYKYGETPVDPTGTPVKPNSDLDSFTFDKWAPDYEIVLGPGMSYKAQFTPVPLPADYTAVGAAQTRAFNDYNDSSLYTATSYARLLAAIAAVETGYTKYRQEDVDKMAADINAAIDALVSPVAYEETYAEATAINNDSGFYTAASYQNFLAAMATIGGHKEFEGETDTQADVDAAKQALLDAMALLEMTNLGIEGAAEVLDENTLRIISNTDSQTTTLVGNDGGANRTVLAYIDQNGNKIENPTKKLGTACKVQLVSKDDGSVLKEKTLIVYGDINGDGQISLADIKLAKKMLVSLDGFTAEQIVAAKCGAAEISVDAIIALARAL